MNKVISLGFLLAVAGFIGIAATGVNLVSNQVGFGFLILGCGGLFAAIGAIWKPSRSCRTWLLLLSSFGGLYFIWRALAAGPIGLAIPDIVLVLTFLGVYSVASCANPKGRRIFIYALSILCVVNVSFALIQIAQNHGFYPEDIDSEEKKAVTGFFTHYNIFSAFSNGLLFIYLTFSFLGKNVYLRLMSGLLSLTIVVTVVLSNSRGGWISLIVGAAVWFVVTLAFLKETKSRAYGGALIGGTLILVIGFVSSFWVVQQLTNIRSNAAEQQVGEAINVDVHDSGRITYQMLAFEIWQDSPILGSGPRAYSYQSLEQWDLDRIGGWNPPPIFAHNEYLQTLSDYGLVGLIIIIGLIFLHVVLGAYSTIVDRSLDAHFALLKIGAIGGVAAMLAQCYFSFLLHMPSCICLLALLMGLLGSKPIEKSGNRFQLGKAISQGVLGLIISASLLAIGSELTRSYQLNREASQQLASANDERLILQALNTGIEAGHAGRDPAIFESIGRTSMIFADNALKKEDSEAAKNFNLEARKAFEGALKYNPHSTAGLAGLPRVEDALGLLVSANKGHEAAMAKLWAREYRLRVHFNAAVNSYLSAFRALEKNKRGSALEKFREGHERMLRRKELVIVFRSAEEKELFLNIEGWIAFLEARLLFREGDDVWKNARPRNPELAHALMLEAQKRYEASEAVVRDQNPNWGKQVEKLQLSLGYLKTGRVQPAKLSEEEIKAILTSQEGLDSLPVTR